MNPISLSYYTVPELSPLEMIDVAAVCGFQHVGLRLLAGQPDDAPLPIMAEAGLRREMARRLADSGLSALDANSARITPRTDVAQFDRFLDVAAELGARHVLATGDDPDLTRLADRFATLCDAAAARGLTVQLEFVPWMTIPSVTAATSFVARVGRANLGIAADALHVHRSGGTASDLAAVPRALLAYMHLCDAQAVFAPDKESQLHIATRERLCPGEGGLDLVAMLRALPPEIPVALEIPMATLALTMSARGRAQRAIDAARRVLAQANHERSDHD